MIKRIFSVKNIIFAVVIVTFLFLTVPQSIEYFKNKIYPKKIFLSLWETGRKIQLTRDGIVVPSLKQIKANQKTIIRFILEQNNFRSPEITAIHMTFPKEAIVEPVKDKWGYWVKNNDDTNTYFLSYSPPAIFSKGSDYNLPAVEVIFKEVGTLNFSYSIIGNQIEPIKRKFTIITDKEKYREYIMQSYNTAERHPETATVSSVRLFDVYDPTITSDNVMSRDTGQAQNKKDRMTSTSEVLGRTDRLADLCDDFEDIKWNYNYQNHMSSNKLWRSGSGFGEPELLARVPTPDGGINGSAGALEIRTNNIELFDNGSSPGHRSMEKLLTAEYKKNSEHRITRANRPVFIVRVWLPPFNLWIKENSKEDYYNFGFRHEAFPKNGDKYYPSLWLHYDNSLSQPWFRCRIFPIGTKKPLVDIAIVPIRQPYWWTLAVAFDEDGIDHYYARPGVGIPTEKDEIFNATQFRTRYGIATPSMDYVLYSFFHLGYPEAGNASPPFVIDDYELWIVERKE